MLIILDTETTGVEAATDRLVELAAVPFDKAKFGPFSTLVNPLRGIPPEAMAIHHITEDMVQLAPSESNALVQLLEHFQFEPSVFVAHNAPFDRAFLERVNPVLAGQWICTYKAALTAWPDAPGHSNQVLRYWLGLRIPEEELAGLYPHRALYDCVVTRYILEVLLHTYSVEELIEISSKPVLLKRVTFGKHKGATWDKVPYGYLKWCVSQTDMNENVLFTARHWMERC